jgi:hypothetical protein
LTIGVAWNAESIAKVNGFLNSSTKALRFEAMRESQEMVFDAHDKAFDFFRGTCTRGIYDNMKTAVARRPVDPGGEGAHRPSPVGFPAAPFAAGRESLAEAIGAAGVLRHWPHGSAANGAGSQLPETDGFCIPDRIRPQALPAKGEM